MNILFSINDDILLSLKEDTEEFTQNLRFLSALTLYRKNRFASSQSPDWELAQHRLNRRGGHWKS
jgi:hypothetical protein